MAATDDRHDENGQPGRIEGHRPSVGRTVFRSTGLQAPGEARAMAVHCSDPRYQPHFQQFLNGRLGVGGYGLIAVPGGPHLFTLTEYLPKFGWAGWHWMKFMVKLTGTGRIVLIAHDDCRWYHDERFGHRADAVVAHQLDDMRRVRSALVERFGPVAVEMYFARLEGREAAFDEVCP